MAVRSQPRLVDRYVKIPARRTQREFWTDEKIAHLRQLATTGHWAPGWAGNGPGERILDRIALKGLDPRAEPPSGWEGVETSVPLAYGRIPMETPLYLGDMSFGALSGIPNVALARAADRTGALCGTGEGGLHPEVRKCRRITVQWASARFGVDLDVLNSGMGTVIKIGQGAKPGIGGHLPGLKVVRIISETRRIPVGADAISPAPHHDIYSIEDLGQRIWALKEATGKPVFVKVGATNYVPYIASGIARMGADGVIMDGHGAGTGAAPEVVKNCVGLPIELATASVDATLRREGLREGFSVIAAGRVSSALDTVRLMALGADCVSIGTGSLVGMGCVMVHKCHTGFCPALLTNKILDQPDKVLELDWATGLAANTIRGWTEEIRLILRAIGVKRARDLIGRRDLLEGLGMGEETLRILGIEGAKSRSGRSVPYPPLESGEAFPESRVEHLRTMAGAVGKAPAEALITSMGSVGPPFIEAPHTVADWLRSDGAQVTRPSIDPYREAIETSTFLAGGALRLSMPVLVGVPQGWPPEARAAVARAALGLGVLAVADESSAAGLDRYADRVLRLEEGHALWAGTRYLRAPPSEESLARLGDDLRQHDVRGVLFDGDLEGATPVPLEVAVSEAEDLLNRTPVNGHPLRSHTEILAVSSRVRGADDIFKLIGLGAHAVGLRTALEVAVGEPLPEPEVVRERTENLLLGIQKELKLLGGAAGISSLSTSLWGSRELFRAVDLDPAVRKRLRVKPAGVG